MSIHTDIRAYLLVIFLLLFRGFTGYAQLSQEKALEDFQFLRSRIHEIHPHPYLYQSQEAEEKLFKKLEASVLEGMDPKEFFQLISTYTTSFQDGHTYPSFEYLSQYFRTSLENGNTYMPIEIDFKADRFYIKDVYEDSLRPMKGAFLVSINDIAADSLIQAFQQYYAKKASLYDNAHTRLFREMFALSFGGHAYWRIVYQRPGAPSTEILVSGLSGKKFIEKQSSSQGDMQGNKKQMYEFDFALGDSIGILTIRAMGDLPRFTQFAKEVFRSLEEKQSPYLIIDMRENGGGSSAIGDELYAYLSNEPYYPGKMYAKISEPIMEWYKRERQGHPLYDEVLTCPVGEFIETPESYREQPKAVEYPYKGTSFLLMGPKTYSSGHMFAGLFKCHEIGTAVGQATGQATKTVGDSFFFRLPNSGIGINVSYKIFEGPCEGSFSQGFSPHINISYSSEDLKRGVDKEVEWVKNYIQNQH